MGYNKNLGRDHYISKTIHPLTVMNLVLQRDLPFEPVSFIELWIWFCSEFGFLCTLQRVIDNLRTLTWGKTWCCTYCTNSCTAKTLWHHGVDNSGLVHINNIKIWSDFKVTLLYRGQWMTINLNLELGLAPRLLYAYRGFWQTEVADRIKLSKGSN